MTIPTNDGADPGVLALEEKARMVQARLDPAAQRQVIASAVEANRLKYVADYGVEPDAAFLDKTAAAKGTEEIQAGRADLQALKVVFETVDESFVKDIVKAEELPSAIEEAEREKGNGLTFEQRLAVTQVEQLRHLNLRQDLDGAGFERLLPAYQQAATSDDRFALRFLERQRSLGWPGVVRDEATLDAQLQLEQLIARTRAGRVPTQLRANHARVSKAWTLTLDTLYRTFHESGLRMAAPQLSEEDRRTRVLSSTLRAV